MRVSITIFLEWILVAMMVSFGACGSSGESNSADAAFDASEPDTGSDENADTETDHEAASDAGVKCVPMHCDVPPFTFEESDVATANPAFLDALATEYACSRNGAQIDDAYFFYGWMPVKLFNQIIAGDIADIKVMRWALALSGYFGGAWLHNGLSGGTASGDGDSSGGMDFSLLNGTAIARAAAQAASGTDAALFAYNKESLLAFMIPNLGIAWDFGYNRGYLLEIYLRPPLSITPPAGYVTCTGLFWCEYRDQRIPILTTLKEVSENLKNKAGRWKELREGSPLNPLDGVEASQNAANAMGQTVWGTIFKKDDMADPVFYNRLLDVSASFLEVVQAAALLSAKGYAEQDAQAGRAGALIQSGLGPWLGAYMESFGPSAAAGIQDLPKILPAE